MTVAVVDASVLVAASLAEALGCALITLDGRLDRAPGIGCPVRLPDGR